MFIGTDVDGRVFVRAICRQQGQLTRDEKVGSSKVPVIRRSDVPIIRCSTGTSNATADRAGGRSVKCSRFRMPPFLVWKSDIPSELPRFRGLAHQS